MATCYLRFMALLETLQVDAEDGEKLRGLDGLRICLRISFYYGPAFLTIACASAGHDCCGFFITVMSATVQLTLPCGSVAESQCNIVVLPPVVGL